MAAKLDKLSVDYSKGMKTRHCAICRSWLGKGQCAIVAGLISPDYWCERFKKAETK